MANAHSSFFLPRNLIKLNAIFSATGQIEVSPCKGSQIMLLTKEEAALFGFPGRIQIAGRRTQRPSTKPFLV